MDFSFLEDEKPSLPFRKSKLSFGFIGWIFGFVCLVLLCTVLHKTSISTQSNMASAETTQRTGSSTTMTKEEWYKRYKELKPLCEARLNKLCPKGTSLEENIKCIHKDDLYMIFGKPFKTQSIEGYVFLYWQCTDGIVQVKPYVEQWVGITGDKHQFFLNDDKIIKCEINDF